jgi:hypothetical protein
MYREFMPCRRAALRIGAALVAAALAGVASATAGAHWPNVVPRVQPLAHVEVYDRATGAILSVYEHGGRQYIVGVPGHEYAVRIRNTTGQRILAVTSVDGVNVVTGDTASPSQPGYVIDPWGSVEIAGWRKSMSRTAAFFFTEHSNSYAARTGRPFDVGVIGVAVFSERIVRPRISLSEKYESGRADAPAETMAEQRAGTTANAPPPPASEPASPHGFAARQRDAGRSEQAAQAQPLAKLGTGHGRSESSHARQVTFERASSDPVQIVAVQYDRHENLVALGIVPPHQDHYARRLPRPFPGVRFVPDPQ